MNVTPPRVLTAAALLTLSSWAGVRLAAEPSSTPRFDWVFDDTVSGTARVGNTLFVGGSFRSLVPTSGALGNLYAVSPGTGATVPSGVPFLDKEASAVTPDGSGGYFVSGTFTTVGPGSGQGNTVHVRNDGSLDPVFVASTRISGTPTVMVRVGPSLVLAGYLFVDSAAQPLVALDAVTGALSPWIPALPPGDANVWDVEVANGVLYVLSGGVSRNVSAFDGATGARLWLSDVTGAPGFGASGQLALGGGRLIAAIGRLYSLDPATGAVDPTWAAGVVSASPVLTMTVAGGTIYVGGPFAAFHGQPRANLAAVDLATGALLPWNPQASEAVFDMVGSPTGTVFVASRSTSMTINGQHRSAVFEIDAAGAVTPFSAAAVAASATLLQISPAGNLLVSGDPGFAGAVSRAGLAAFDAVTGALLPTPITLSANGGPAAVGSLVALGDVLYMRGAFDTVNGQARGGLAAVDVTSGTVLPWPSPGVTLDALLLGAGRYIYFPIPGTNGQLNHRRVDAITGAFDPVWQPTVSGTLHLVGNDLVRVAQGTGGGCNFGAVVGALDRISGVFSEWFRTSAFNTAMATSDGDTLYLAGAVPNPVPGFCYVGSALFGYDRKTFTPVSAPPVAGDIGSVGVADGRVFVAGNGMSTGGAPFSGVIDLPRPGAVGGFRQAGFRKADVRGDLMVAEGSMSGRPRLAAFPLLGAPAPSNLRTRQVGGAVEFTWSGPATPPAGGFVLEAGLAPGQIAAAVPVGAGTTLVTPVAVPGPIFVRMSNQLGTEVSNEVVVGCVAPPRPPTALTTTLNGTALTLAWTAPLDDVTSYTLLAGSAAGLTDVATLPLGPQTSVSGTVPGGTFFTRVIASNGCGTSGPSGEVFFTIGALDPLPAAPTNLASMLAGNTVALSWTPPAGAVTGYVLEAGTAAGLANLGSLRIGATPSLVVPGVPPGTYVMRVRAISSAGTGTPSPDVVVVVP